MIENINLEYLRIFYHVAKCGNLTRASEILHISQPAITQTIKKLEDTIGITLFIRTKRGVILTKDGENIYEMVGNLEVSVKNINNYLQLADELNSGELVVASGGNIARKVIVSAFKKFHKEHPNIKLIQYENTQDEMLNELKNGRIDICISQHCECEDNIKFTHLFDEKHIFVCSKEYYDGVLESAYTYIIQAKGSYSRKIFDSVFEDGAKICVENVGYNLAKAFCLDGVGVALLPSYLVEDEIKCRKLIEVHKNFMLPTVQYGYFVNKNYKTKVLLEFIKYIV